MRPFELSVKASPRFAYYLVSPRATAERPLTTAFRQWVLEEVGESERQRRDRHHAG